MKRQFMFLLALLLLTAMPFAAQGQEESVLNYAIRQSPDTIDVNLTTASGVVNMMSHVYDTLVYQHPLGTFHPGLANSWDINEDATEYTFYMRDDATFHDGTPVNAHAVKFTIEHIQNPENNAQGALSVLGPLEEVEVVDDHTVTFRFSAPYAVFLNSVSLPMLGLNSPTAVAELGEDYGLTKVVGSGAYMVESYVIDDSLVLVKNPNWTWGPEEVFGTSGPANFDRIVFTFVLDQTSRVAALEAGQADFADGLSTADVERLSANEDLTILAIEQPGHGYSLMFNAERYPSNQLSVRQAIAHSIDKQAIVDIVFNGYASLACSPFTRAMPFYNDVQCQVFSYDPDKARAILEADGWVDTDGDGIREKDGEPLRLEHWTIVGGLRFPDVSVVIEPFIDDIGIDFNLNIASRAGYFDAVRAGEHHTQHWWDTSIEPDTVMRTLFHSSNADGGTNRNRYRDEEMDALILAGSSTAVTEEREAIYHQLQQKIADEVIMLFMVDPFLLYGSAANLQGVTYLAGGNISNLIGASFSDE
jgi:peptide/nickel transport system substrate-binding protein